MMINLDREIQQAKTVEDLRPLLLILQSAVNTLNDARAQVRGDLVFHDKGMVMRCNDGKYYRVLLELSSGVPELTFTLIGTNPTGV